jgi:CIC family chloride channel protein
VLIVKSFIWVFSLGSNTAGGILAPLLMIGGALGAALGHLMPVMSPGAWVLVGMCAVLSAAIGAPLTSAMLALELTHNGGLMLPVLLSCVAAYAVSVLVQPRSMLTENLARRGLHLSREFGVDPLETMLVSQAMHTSVFALPESATRKDAADWLAKMEERGSDAWSHWQRIFPLVDGEGHLRGTVTRAQMIGAAHQDDLSKPLIQDANCGPQTVSPFMTLRACAAAMAESNLTSYPVVSADGKLLGVMTINDLLKGRSEQAHRESDRERVLRLRWPFGGKAAAAVAAIDSEKV